MTTKTNYEDITRSLSSTMKAVMLTGVIAGGRVVGKTNTIVALMDRGLITGGRQHSWTALGREVARALDPSVMTLDELHGVALTEDAHRFPEPTTPTTVTRESDGAQFTIGQHVTVHGFPGMHWLITDVYAAGVYGPQPAATGETAPLNGQNARLLILDALAHVDSPEQPQESAYLTPTDAANVLARRLVEALDSLSAAPPTPTPADDDVDALVKRIVRRAQYDALKAMRSAVVRSRAAVSPERWAEFPPENISKMIDDAARELGIPSPLAAP